MIVSQSTGILDLLPLVAHQTKACSDPTLDLEYLWQCMTLNTYGHDHNMKPIDAQRVRVMQCVGDLFHKMQNYTTAQWFPNVSYAPNGGLTPKDITHLRQQVEALRALCTEEQLTQVPSQPKLYRCPRENKYTITHTLTNPNYGMTYTRDEHDETSRNTSDEDLSTYTHKDRDGTITTRFSPHVEPLPNPPLWRDGRKATTSASFCSGGDPTAEHYA